MLEHQIQTIAAAVREAQANGWPSVSSRLDLPSGRTFVTFAVRPDGSCGLVREPSNRKAIH